MPVLEAYDTADVLPNGGSPQPADLAPWVDHAVLTKKQIGLLFIDVSLQESTTRTSCLYLIGFSFGVRLDRIVSHLLGRLTAMTHSEPVLMPEGSTLMLFTISDSAQTKRHICYNKT